MITNSKITIFHKTINKTTRLEEYTPKVYIGWVFIDNSSVEKDGTAPSRTIKARLSLDLNKIGENEIAIDDLIIKGEKTNYSELKYGDFFRIAKVNYNDFGNNPHIYIIG